MRNKVIAFDLDDVLCYRTSEEGQIKKYHTCEPNKDMIDIVNQCHDIGHKIIIYTARGMTSFDGSVDDIYSNLYVITFEQLKNWGVRFDQLVMGKIHYDLLIDDKALNSENVSKLSDIKEFLSE